MCNDRSNISLSSLTLACPQNKTKGAQVPAKACLKSDILQESKDDKGQT